MLKCTCNNSRRTHNFMKNQLNMHRYVYTINVSRCGWPLHGYRARVSGMRMIHTIQRAERRRNRWNVENSSRTAHRSKKCIYWWRPWSPFDDVTPESDGKGPKIPTNTQTHTWMTGDGESCWRCSLLCAHLKTIRRAAMFVFA